MERGEEGGGGEGGGLVPRIQEVVYFCGHPFQPPDLEIKIQLLISK